MYQHATSLGAKISSSQISTSGFEVPLRNYRRSMKPRLHRKITASSRINLNRFWNELEEFYNRYDDRKAKNSNNPLISKIATSSDLNLPAYTTDTFDHEREAAENRLNERLELAPMDSKSNTITNSQCCDCCCTCDLENNYPVKYDNQIRDRIHSCGVESESSSVGYQSSSDFESEPDSDDDIFFGASNNRQQHHWNTMNSVLPSTPRPPRTLLDLIHHMGLKEF